MLTVASTLGLQGWSILFNNFAVEVLRLDGSGVGLVQSLREVPGFSVAINTYFQKVADHRDIAPNMAIGFTINHIAAVVLPLVGGALWMIDYRIPFAAGAVVGIVGLAVVQRISVPEERGVVGPHPALAGLELE